MPDIGPRCHELRIPDRETPWRIFYRIDKDAIDIVFDELMASSRRNRAFVMP